MKEIYLDNIKQFVDKTFTGQFLIVERTVSKGKTGKDYMTVSLMDKTGKQSAKIWDNVEVLARRFKVDDFVEIKAAVVLYNGAPQINIRELHVLPPESIERADFIPVASIDIEAEFDRMMVIANGMTDPFLKQLIEAIFADETVVKRFKESPAAKTIHHSYVGGLLEHTLSLLDLSVLATTHYPYLNRDLLITSAILHDFGKIYEIGADRSFAYTDEGRLIGHIILEVEAVSRHIDRIAGFPVQLALELKHILLAHHGEYAFGSPKIPMTMEALVVSSLDKLDAHLNAFKSLIERGSEDTTNFTAFAPMFDRALYKNRDLTKLRNQAEPVVPPPVSDTVPVSGKPPVVPNRKIGMASLF